MDKISLKDFTNAILEAVFDEMPDAQLYKLSESDIFAILDLAENKYSTWEWVYGNTPKFTYNNIFRFDKGTIELQLNVVSGIINGLAIYGDFFGVGEIKELTKHFIGLQYDKTIIKQAIANIDVGHYIWGLEKDALLDGSLTNNFKQIKHPKIGGFTPSYFYLNYIPKYDFSDFRLQANLCQDRS